MRVVASPTPSGVGSHVVTLVHGDEAAGDAEHQALDDAFIDVAQVDGILRLRPERADIDTHLLHADELRAEQPDHAERGGEQRHGDDAAQEPRRDDVAQRIHGHHLHGGQLIGALHETDLRRQGRTCPSGKQQRRQHGPEHLEHAERREYAERILGAESLQRVEPQQAEHHADEQPRQHDDDQRASAGVVDLLDDESGLGERGDHARQHLPKNSVMAPMRRNAATAAESTTALTTSTSSNCLK